MRAGLAPRRRAVPLIGVWALACAAPSWDVAALEARYPSLRAVGSGNLAATTPYLLPSRGKLTFFLCRWPTGTEIPVRLPPDAASQERKSRLWRMYSRRSEPWTQMGHLQFLKRRERWGQGG